jgi:hypothetical protein
LSCKEKVFSSEIFCALVILVKRFAENNTLSVNLSIRFGKETVKAEALPKEVALHYSGR